MSIAEPPKCGKSDGSKRSKKVVKMGTNFKTRIKDMDM
jgi:hypothetical protein